MTTKEIAEAAGVSVDTVQRKVREMFPAEVQSRKATNLTQAKAIKVMAEIRKINFVSPLPQDAVALPQDAVALDSAFKMALITLTAMAQGMEARLSKIENKIEQRQALLPAPQIPPRSNVVKIVREYATKNEIDYSMAFTKLYREFGYRTHTDPRKAAGNRGVPIIDYIDTEGMMGTLEAVAMEMLNDELP